MRLCKWCYHVRIKTQRNHDYHPRCKGLWECECKCRFKYNPPKPYNEYHVVANGIFN